MKSSTTISLAFSIWIAVANAVLGAAAEPVPFEVHNGYFVSNKFEPEAPTSFVVIADRAAFDRVFGVARVMGDKSNRLPDNAFASKLVIAAIRRGKAMWQFKVETVSAEDGVLTMTYTTTSQEQPAAEFACPLIVSVPKAEYRAVSFVENGKPVKSIEVAKSVNDKEPVIPKGIYKKASPEDNRKVSAISGPRHGRIRDTFGMDVALRCP